MSQFQPYSANEETQKQSESETGQNSSAENPKDEENDVEDYTPHQLVSRAEWRAKPPKWMERLELPVEKVVVSFTETRRCEDKNECIRVVQKLQEAHMAEEDVPDLKHNFLIGGDGTVYEGRGYTRVGPVYPPSANRIELLNHSSIDIGIIGPRSQIVGDVKKGLTACVSNGVHLNFIDEDFETFYIVNNEIAYVHSEKEERIKKFEMSKPD